MKSKKIINHFGAKYQILKAIEELAELQRELAKYLASFQDDLSHNLEYSKGIAEEITNVELIIEQLKIIFNFKNIKDLKKYKLQRTLKNYDII